MPAPASALSEGEPDRPNIIFIDIDTWRADRLLAERDGQPIAPNMAALSARSHRFSEAFTQGGWTMPGLAALLSGRWPMATLARDFDLAWLPPNVRLLPEILSIYGYQTVFYGNEALVASTIGTTQFQTVIPPDTGPQPWVAPLTSWIVREAREPFFALLADIDLHMPRPPLSEDQAHRFSGPEPACVKNIPQSPQPIFDATVRSLGPERARQHAIDHYDAGVAAYDAALGGLFQMLDERGLAERTVIVLTSNHGEELGEHGFFSHGLHWDTVLQVPLVIYDPRRADKGGQVIEELVQTIDVAPTLLDLAGIPVDAQMNGQSLRPLMDRTDGFEPRDVFSLSDAATGSIRTPTTKLLLHRISDMPRSNTEILAVSVDDPALQVRAEYYLLDTDPGELHDVAAEHPEEVATLRSRLEAWLEVQSEFADKNASKSDPALVERLKADGYWQHVGQQQPGADMPPGADHPPGPPQGLPMGPPLGPDGQPIRSPNELPPPPPPQGQPAPGRQPPASGR